MQHRRALRALQVMCMLRMLQINTLKARTRFDLGAGLGALVELLSA